MFKFSSLILIFFDAMNTLSNWTTAFTSANLLIRKKGVNYKFFLPDFFVNNFNYSNMKKGFSTGHNPNNRRLDVDLS